MWNLVRRHRWSFLDHPLGVPYRLPEDYPVPMGTVLARPAVDAGAELFLAQTVD